MPHTVANDVFNQPLRTTKLKLNLQLAVHCIIFIFDVSSQLPSIL